MSEADEIKKLKQEIEQLKSDRDKFRLIAEFTNDLEYWMDPKGAFLYISPGCKNITGYAAESIYQNPGLFQQLIHSEDRAMVLSFINKCLDLTIINESLSFRLITKSMLTRYCEITSKAVYDPRGKYLGQRGSIRDISRLKETLRQVKDISEGKVWEEQAKNRFKELAEQRDRELTSSIVQMSQKNELLQHIRKKLGSLQTSDEKLRKLIHELKQKINQEVSNSDLWEEFKLHFENNHPGFFVRLSTKYPRLTSRDLKLCAYIRLRLSTKEMAGLLNITPKSAEISRVRLRKKLNLIRRDDLGTFISRI